MSESNTDQQISTSETDQSTATDGTDWLLQALISGYADHGVQITVTLTVGGSVVSGLLIGGRTYFAEVQEMLSAKSQGDGDIFAEIAEDFGSIGPDVYDKPDDASDEWKPSPPNYIHLKSARFHAPGHGGIPAKDGFLWRGKLASVDAFSIGSLSATPPSEDD